MWCPVPLVPLLLVLATLSTPGGGLHVQDGHKLLVILLDGVRWDAAETPGFRRMAEKGVKAQYLEPVFPATTMPNLYTVMTGQYPESHGQTGDYMYDAKKQLSFNKMTKLNIDSDPLWWNSGNPFWVKAVSQNKRVFLYRWPGCEVYIRGVKPTFCKPIGDWTMSITDLQDSVNESIKLFSNDTADFVGIYFNEPEKTEQEWGLRQRPDVMDSISDVIAELQTTMEKTPVKDDVRRHLSDVINVMVLSDHGFTHLSPTRVINMTSQLMTASIAHIVSDGSTVQIWTAPEAIDKVYASLNASASHYNAYRLGHMPEVWHYRTGPFVAPILLLANPGYTFLTPKSPTFPTFTEGGRTLPQSNGHGYVNDHPDMRGIFYARGPHFKENLRDFPGFSIVHLYQVMCAILGVDMSSNAGSWSVVEGMLIDTHIPNIYHYNTHVNKFITSLIVLTLLFCLVSVGCALWCRRENLRRWYNQRGIQWQPLHDGVI